MPPPKLHVELASQPADEPPRAGPPQISICVPTHHGRREALGALLAGVIEQARDLPGQVEVCVSDNASDDGTAELVSELARHAPCPIIYRRHDTDLGLGRNLLAATELARGRYCWLLGSDDLLVEGGLWQACELLEQMPDATGYVVGAVHCDADDPSLRSRSLSRAFFPPGDIARLVEGIDAVYDECGNAWCALSWSLVDRERWLHAARSRFELVTAHPVYPQVVVLATMAADRPVWGWLPEPLVRQRNATTFLFEHGRTPLADRWSLIIAGLPTVWAAVLGSRYSGRWRRRMRLLHRVWGGEEDMRATKLYDKPGLRSQARLALCCCAAFWPAWSYWRRVLPVTLAPVWLSRLRYAPDRPLAANTRRRSARLRVSTDPPGRLRAESVVSTRIDLRNATRRTAHCAGPYAVAVAQHWFTQEGVEVTGKALGLNQLAEMPQALPRTIRGRRSLAFEICVYVPRSPGVYTLQLVPVQLHAGWVAEPVTQVVEVVARSRRPASAARSAAAGSPEDSA